MFFSFDILLGRLIFSRRILRGVVVVMVFIKDLIELVLFWSLNLGRLEKNWLIFFLRIGLFLIIFRLMFFILFVLIGFWFLGL